MSDIAVIGGGAWGTGLAIVRDESSDGHGLHRMRGDADRALTSTPRSAG